MAPVPDRHFAALATELWAAMPPDVRLAELRFVVEDHGIRLLGRFIGNEGTSADAKLPAEAIRAVMRSRAEPASGPPWHELGFRWSATVPDRCEFDVLREETSAGETYRVVIGRPPAVPVSEQRTGPVDVALPGRADAQASASDPAARARRAAERVPASGRSSEHVPASGRSSEHVPAPGPSSEHVPAATADRVSPSVAPRPLPPSADRFAAELAAIPASGDPVADALEMHARLRGTGHRATSGGGPLASLATATGIVPEWFGSGRRAWASLRERCMPTGSTAVAVTFASDDRTIDRVFTIQSCVDGLHAADLRERCVVPLERLAASGLGTLYADPFDADGRWAEQRPPVRPHDIDDNARARAEYALAVRRHHARTTLVQLGRVPIEGTRLSLVPDLGALRVQGSRVTPRRAADLAIDLARDVLAELVPPGASSRQLMRLTPRGRILAADREQCSRTRSHARWVNPAWIGTRVLSEVRGLHEASNGGARRGHDPGDPRRVGGRPHRIDATS